jgi:hypothetical protein
MAWRPLNPSLEHAEYQARDDRLAVAELYPPTRERA